MIGLQSFSSAISGVLYAEDFDEPPPRTLVVPKSAARPLPEPEIIAPTFTLDELRAATEQAHEEGRVSAQRAAAESQATEHGNALKTLAEQLRLASEQSTGIVEQGLDAIARTALALLSAALPELCAKHAQDEVRALLRRVLPPTRQLSELHIRLNPSLRQAIEEQTLILLEGSPTQVVWTESSKLLPGDISISWQNGSVLRDTRATCASIRDAVLALFQIDEREKLAAGAE